MNKGLILTYHAANVSGNDYGNNDHVALFDDLKQIHNSEWEFCSLERMVREIFHAVDGEKRLIALTFDDGTNLDYTDFHHPIHGFQRSFAGIIEDYIRAQPQSVSQPHGSSFVIASPEARNELDRKDFMSLGIWGDDWWKSANELEWMSIENHSWDHNHPSLSLTAQRNQHKGDFLSIETPEECDLEVRESQEYIGRISGRLPRFFAYPWGEASRFLRRNYMPVVGPKLGLTAAVSGEHGIVSNSSDIWYLPRYVCGFHWKTQLELSNILTESD